MHSEEYGRELIEKSLICSHKGEVTYGKKMACALCRGPVVCGALMHACEKCDPFEFQRCGGCGTMRLFCTC